MIEESWKRDKSDTEHKVFRDLFLLGNWDANRPDATTLMQDVKDLRASRICATGTGGSTLSDADEKLVGDNLNSHSIIIDEAGTATER